MASADLFENPFAGYNANVMTDQAILDLWCDPFEVLESKFSSSDLFTDAMPIALLGGRGSGKTMLMKYWGFDVQLVNARKRKEADQIPSVLQHFVELGAIATYVRIDGPKLRAFDGRGLTKEKWEVLFAHFFELVVAESVFELLHTLESADELPTDCFDKTRPILGEYLEFGTHPVSNFGDVAAWLKMENSRLRDYLKKLILSEAEFVPDKIFGISDLSSELLSKLGSKVFPDKNNLKFVVLLDEYENFLDYQQVLINTLIKFPRNGATIRVGMRLEGFRSYNTVNPTEYIKVGRDYREIVFEDVLVPKTSGYRNFVKRIARIRLENSPSFARQSHVEIEKLLGTRENLEEEAVQLVNRSKATDAHFKIIPKSKNLKAKDLKLLRYPDNPLIEMLNVVLVVRGADPLSVNKAMNGYLADQNTDEAKKYGMDYRDKYKLSLMFLLSTCYRSRKTYYSFNTFLYLSSGIVGNFIELCRRTFQLASFEQRDQLLNEGLISKEVQDSASRELAEVELQMAGRISEYGTELKRLIKNIGNSFRDYHTDIRLRYPETNQIAINFGSGPPQRIEQIFRSAIEWSILQRKPSLQRTAPSSDRDDIYTLNRIFSPLFGISYRTRGGFSETYSVEEFEERTRLDEVKSKLRNEQSTSEPGTDQMFLL